MHTVSALDIDSSSGKEKEPMCTKVEEVDQRATKTNKLQTDGEAFVTRTEMPFGY